jgi:hypothetical protein
MCIDAINRRSCIDHTGIERVISPDSFLYSALKFYNFIVQFLCFRLNICLALFISGNIIFSSRKAISSQTILKHSSCLSGFVQ